MDMKVFLADALHLTAMNYSVADGKRIPCTGSADAQHGQNTEPLISSNI